MSDFLLFGKKNPARFAGEIFWFALFLRGVLGNTVYIPWSVAGELAVNAWWLAVA
jgi:hypothetical protein